MRLISKLIMDSAQLLAKVQSNSVLLNNKISSLQTLLDHAPEKVRTSAESQKVALRLENEVLKKEIEQLVGKLTYLEVATGVKQVASAAGCVINTNIDTPVVKPSPSPAAPKAKEPSPKPAVEATPAPAGDGQGKGKKDKKKGGGSATTGTPDVAAGDERVDVSRLDLRIGRIISAKKHPDADSLYVEEVDLGEGKNRTVVSGLVKFVPIEEMQNRLALLMCNLKPAKMRGVASEAMVMCASTPDKVEILVPPEGSVPGDRVTVDGYPGEPDAQLNPKKKIWESVAPDLKTNGECVATYKGVAIVVPGKGAVKAPSLANVQIK